MDRRSQERAPARETPAPQGAAGRTFARRIDCADTAGRSPAMRPARGGGLRDPETWEHGRAYDR